MKIFVFAEKKNNFLPRFYISKLMFGLVSLFNGRSTFV